VEAPISRATQSKQLADDIERKIRSGELKPGFKMPSFREIGEAYGVSFQVVKSAATILESRGLAVCEPRIGFYVSPKALEPARRSIAVLHIKDASGAGYSEERLALSSDGLWDDCCVSRRQLPPGSESKPELAYEVERIAASNPDCLLVFLPGLKEKELALFRKLPFPVAFIGDFHDGALNGKVPNLILEDTAGRVESFMERASSKGRKDVLLFTSASGEERSYVKALADAGKAKAERLGVRFRHSVFRDEGEGLRKSWDKALDGVLKEGAPDAILLDGARGAGALMEALAARGFEGPDAPELASPCEMQPGAVFVKSDCSGFARKAKELMERLIADPKTPIGIQVVSGGIERSFLRVS